MKKLIIVLIISLCLPSVILARQYRITVKAYTAHRNQTDANPNETAFGHKPKKGITIAVSKDLAHLKGKNVKLIDNSNKVVGIYKVQDRMPNRNKKKQKIRKSADIFFGKNKKLAKEFGVQKNVRLIVL